MTRSDLTKFAEDASSENENTLPGLDEVLLSPEEEELFDAEFLRDCVSNAIAAVQKVEYQRNVRVSQLLAMRDLLFANWLRRVSPSGGEDPDPVAAFESALFDLPTPAVDPSGGIELPEEAFVIQKVTQYVADRDLSVKDYLRLVDASGRFSQPISEATTDDELSEIFELLETE